MNAITKIAEAFQVLIPAIKKQRIEFITSTLERLARKYGDWNGREMRDLYHSWGADGGAYRSCRTFLRYTDRTAVSHSFGDPMEIDHERIEKVSEADAKAEVAAFVAKLERKLADLDEAELVYASGPRFEINGLKNGHTVRVLQEMTVNVSSRGKLFNQFPARIYIDGTFTSEKKYKEWIAAGAGA